MKSASGTMEYCRVEPGHQSVPLLDYGGKPWCRFCEAAKRRSVNLLRKWLGVCQWGLVLSLPFLAATLSLLAPAPVEGAPPNLAFWLWMVVPTVFLGTVGATVAGRTVLTIVNYFQRGRLRLYPWICAAHLLRDWFLISVMMDVFYTLLLVVGHEIPAFPTGGNTATRWLVARGPVLFVTTMLSILILDRLKWITQDKLLPGHAGGVAYLPVYGVAMLGSLWLVRGELVPWVLSHPSRIWLTLSTSITIFLGTLTIVVWVAFRTRSAALHEHRAGPIPATIAIVGPSNVGKTVFLARANSLLRRHNFGARVEFKGTPSANAVLWPIISELESARRWPTAGLSACKIPFSLVFGLNEVIRFNWLDLPGAVFTKPGDWEMETGNINDHLLNSDAVAMLVDATDLAEVGDVRDLKYGVIYFEFARKLYQRLNEVGPGARPVPMAIIITKSCLVKPAQRHQLKSGVRSLVNCWVEMARVAGLPRPAVRVYLTSSVVTSTEMALPPKGKLEAQFCVEPLLWLVSEIMRANISLIDMSSGFLGATSPLQETLVRLNAASRGD